MGIHGFFIPQASTAKPLISDRFQPNNRLFLNSTNSNLGDLLQRDHRNQQPGAKPSGFLPV
jgi:hypothetical protein